MHVSELSTPALVADRSTVDSNIDLMSDAHPGARLRPHVKAFKSTALAGSLADAGHRNFCCAVPREVLGMAAAGLGADLLLANETLDPGRLRAMADCEARVTVAVDSEPTIEAAAANGIEEVLVDINVGLPRCGAWPDDAGRLADLARSKGLAVRGVMGYEGHAMVLEDRQERADAVEASMELLLAAHEAVGGDIVSAGGTLTYDLNTWCNELQAGSYVLMDTTFAGHVPFRQAMWVTSTVLSISSDGYAVADCGLKSLGMDHGNPSLDAGDVWFCSDEHLTFSPAAESEVSVGDRIRVWPAHIDPTVAKHEVIHVTDDRGQVVGQWPVDLRGW